MRLEPWEELQNTVRDMLDRVDGPARVTMGSGSVKGNGDVISKTFMVECKLRTKKNITIVQETWNKIKEEAALLERVPAIVSKNESGEIIISMKLEDLERIME